MRPAFRRTPALALIVLSLTATACGGSASNELPQTAAAPAGPATWGELAPNPPAPAPKIAAARHYQVPIAGALPEVDALESLLARTGLVADVGDEADGRVVESKGVRCSIQPGPRLGDDVLPSPKIEPEYAKWGLTMAEAEQLQASTGTAEIACKPSTSALMEALVAIQVTEAIVTLKKGLVRDPVLGKWFSPAAWDALHGERHFAVEAHVRVDVTGDGALRALRTTGLNGFGRAELALFPVAAADADAAAARLLVLADGVLQEDPPAAGVASSLGPAKFVYLAPDVYTAHAPKGPKPADLADTLVLADPKGRPGAQAGVDALVRRLVAQ